VTSKGELVIIAGDDRDVVFIGVCSVVLFAEMPEVNQKVGERIVCRLWNICGMIGILWVFYRDATADCCTDFFEGSVEFAPHPATVAATASRIRSRVDDIEISCGILGECEGMILVVKIFCQMVETLAEIALTGSPGGSPGLTLVCTKCLTSWTKSAATGHIHATYEPAARGLQCIDRWLDVKYFITWLRRVYPATEAALPFLFYILVCAERGQILRITTKEGRPVVEIGNCAHHGEHTLNGRSLERILKDVV
jgi:hypothetical protein